MTPAQKRNKEDFEMANEIMAAASQFMRAVNKARERGLYVSGSLMWHPFESIKVNVRRDFKTKSIRICEADIGQ